jgi:hypothetical protein
VQRRCERIERELSDSIEANRQINERWAQLAKYSEYRARRRRCWSALIMKGGRSCADIPQELLAHMQEQVRTAAVQPRSRCLTRCFAVQQAECAKVIAGKDALIRELHKAVKVRRVLPLGVQAACSSCCAGARRGLLRQPAAPGGRRQ